ncbi:hypothetical protein PAECIP111892_03178 [Paenibacillus auburnensis]|uniref:GtrA/DPMS transmembrane domain-containing protein n=1 Tax=Paenibacillus auburnensis TaxID=2905649 RepID=A0ABM9CB49_9BACL|nr:GtrA family protein [Paenibacillus auburnensis]CAH1209232.1 hypothetical protein PAECIP111892_03178 [Paenibacillus auburnensis]
MTVMGWLKEKFYENITFFKFILVGVLNTLVGLGSIFILFNTLHFNYWVSTSLGNIIGIICSYVLNKNFTFQSKKSTNKTVWRFFLISLLCYLISYYLGHILNMLMNDAGLLEKGKLTENVSILVASGLYTISNYVGHKYYTFRKS